MDFTTIYYIIPLQCDILLIGVHLKHTLVMISILRCVVRNCEFIIIIILFYLFKPTSTKPQAGKLG